MLQEVKTYSAAGIIFDAAYVAYVWQQMYRGNLALAVCIDRIHPTMLD